MADPARSRSRSVTESESARPSCSANPLAASSGKRPGCQIIGLWRSSRTQTAESCSSIQAIPTRPGAGQRPLIAAGIRG